METKTQNYPIYYDKVLYQKFHPLYTLFTIIHITALIFYIRRYYKGSEKVIFLPIAFFLLRVVDLLYHFGSDYHEAEIVTSNVSLIPFSILIAKYISFLPRYNDFPVANGAGNNIFGTKEIKHFVNTIKAQYQKSLTPLIIFTFSLLILMAFGISNLFITNFFFFSSCAISFIYLLFATLEVRLAKNIRTKANLVVSNLFLLGLHYGLKLILPWRLYADTLYSLFFAIQYIIEISTVFLITDIITSLMLIKYIVYV